MWAYRAIFKQTNVDATTFAVLVKPKKGTRLLLLHVCIGPDDYAAARSLNLAVKDENDDVILRLMSGSLDNQKIYGPAVATREASVTSNTVESIGIPHPYYLISHPDYLIFTFSSLEQNETATVTIRALIFGADKPDISVPTAGITTTTKYNKFI